MIWKREKNSDDQWYRSGALLSFHRDYHYYSWADLQTVSNTNKTSLEDNHLNLNLNHPKIYVGAFKHAQFREKYTRFDTLATAQWDEFRSNDWYYLPGSSHGDLVDGMTIPTNFTFGVCTGPRHRAKHICERPVG